MIAIVAEISANHNKNINYIEKSLNAIKQSGCDYVKFQSYTADEMCIDTTDPRFTVTQNNKWQGANLYKLYTEGSLPYNFYKDIIDICNGLRLKWFSTPFSIKGVEMLEALGCRMYKIASFEITFHQLLKEVASTKKPIILSNGVATLQECQNAITIIKSISNAGLTMLKCVSNYPTELVDCNIGQITELRKLFDIDIGLSDHTKCSTAALLAVALNAKIIEKHFNYSQSVKTLDSHFSLNHNQMVEFVNSIRNAESALGESNINISTVDESSRYYMRSIYASKNINQGEKFTKYNTKILRPKIGLSADKYSRLLENTSKTNYQKDSPISPNEILH